MLNSDTNKTETLNAADAESAVSHIIETVGPEIVLGIPLGLGKPNQFVNALYHRVAQDSSLSLKIITALSLEKPNPKNDVEARLVTPLVERLFGDYNELDYTKAIRKHQLPDNIQVSEFYFKAGAFKKNTYAQQHYISANYTHVAQLLLDMGVNVVAQLVAEQEHNGEDSLSLSCNTDVLLDVFKYLDDPDIETPTPRPLFVAQVHRDMPFMHNKAVVSPNRFDVVIRNEQYHTRLFATPNQKVELQDYAIGVRVSTLIKDGGTLQIGIGALGDAIVHALKIRHAQNHDYQRIVTALQASNQHQDQSLSEQCGDSLPFERGLYGSSEMFINGFMHLIEAGIVKRQVYAHEGLQRLINQGVITDAVSGDTLQALLDTNTISSPLTKTDVDFLKHWGIVKQQLLWNNGTLSLKLDEQVHTFDSDLSDRDTFHRFSSIALGDKLRHGIFMHGGFFLGPHDFYEKLRTAPDHVQQHICMDSVGEINQLLFNPKLKLLQRQHARFINTTMMVTLSGACVSDGLENSTVISGIGGQYNFVAMAHDLPGARSVICVRSVRKDHKGEWVSNIVPHYGHASIPRHLRDIVVTEYGIADLRGKTDSEVMKAMIHVADSRFQSALLEHAKDNGKIEADYEIPAAYRNNTPKQMESIMALPEHRPLFPKFPLGTDFSEEEVALVESLSAIKAQFSQPASLLKRAVQAFIHHDEAKEKEAEHFLERMQLAHPSTPKEHLLQHLLLMELDEKGYLKAL